MDVPKQRSKAATKVSFESSDSQESSSASEDELDSPFNKYSCTPPSRQNIKGMQKRRELRILNSPKLSLEKIEKDKKEKATSTTHRWQQRETSKQRVSERRLKWITSSDNEGPMSMGESAFLDGYASEDEGNSDINTPSNQGIKVESRNRFMSLCSRLIKLPRKVKKTDSLQQSKQIISCQSRTEFQNYFTNLMKSSSTTEKSTVQETQEKSEEELLWQSELKDLLWLELQAWISDRTPQEQDNYLYVQRKKIPDILKRIMEYRFEPFYPTSSNNSRFSASGSFQEALECPGCLDAFCETCSLNQSKALYEISALLKELEIVEELYPSGRALGLDYPLYSSTEFNDRLKAILCWYNVTCLLQLKIDIIGHMLISLGSKGLPWPTWPAWPIEDGDSAKEEIDIDKERHQLPELDGCNRPNSDEMQSPTIILTKKRPLRREKSRVQFFIQHDPSAANRINDHHHMEDSPTESCKSEYSGNDLPEADAELKHEYITEHHLYRDDAYIPCSKPEHLRLDSFGATSETESESYKSGGLETPDGRLLYRHYIERALKSKGLRKMLRWIVIIHRVSMMRAKESLLKPDHYRGSSCSTSPYLYEESEPAGGDRQASSLELGELRRYGAWSEEIQSLKLPQYRTLYLFLCRMPMDVIRESLCIRLEQKPAEPSALSIRQLMQEFKEGLKVGVICKQKYRRDVHSVMPTDYDVSLHNALEKEFNDILKLTLGVYLDYLKRWVCMGSPTKAIQKNVLESEWNFTRSVCSEIPGGEMLAGNSFCAIASSMLSSTGKYLRDGISRRMEFQSDTSGSETDERSEKDMALSILRRIQRVLSEARDQCLKAVSVTKMIRRDLEVAAEFDINVPIPELLERLAITGHVLLVLPHNDNYAVFVPQSLRSHREYLHCLLDLSSRSEPPPRSSDDKEESLPCYSQTSEDDAENEGYMILLQTQTGDGETIETLWKGETVRIHNLRDDAILRSHVQREVLLLIVFNAIHLSARRREVQETLGPGLELRYENRPSNYVVAESLLQLKNEVIYLSQTIIQSIEDVINKCNIQFLNVHLLDPVEQAPLISRWKEVVRHCFKLGFEFNKDVLRLVSGKPNVELALNVVKLANLWMSFTVKHSERGRGLRPKWATQGLEFLVTACESDITYHLSDEEFCRLKESVSQCVHHVIGSLDHSSKTQSLSPAIRRFSKSSMPVFPNSLSADSLSPSLSPMMSRKMSLNISREELSISFSTLPRRDSANDILPWKQRVGRSIDLIESARDVALEEATLIGRVSRQTKEAKWHIRLKSVQFSWQRGVKIGQGRFGKVYVAVNNQTGELMAMKEIALQPNDHRTIRSVVDELHIFEGIHHPHLVRYYGLEIHREEMIIFMEFCPEGTLENLVASTETGLPEELIRRFTRQLLEAVTVLHENGIVHRDIKGANIFLTDVGNCLKLGDFGCAAKIKSQTTMFGELQGFVGTQAFMAPEVFMHTMTEGHGRAADIWSVGCVVIEMATGKRPWYELESNYAIMFKVGMGEVPPAPPTLSEEGQAFLSHVLQHDPKQRETAANLLEHNFLKVYQEDDPSYSAVTHHLVSSLAKR